MTRTGIAVLFTAPLLLAQQKPLVVHAVYVCNGERMEVTGCNNFDKSDNGKCQVAYPDRPLRNGFTVYESATRGDLTKKIQSCEVEQMPAPSQPAPAQARPRPTTPLPIAQPSTGGFKIADTVQVDTAFGWMDAKVLAARGNSYFVHVQSGAEVWKNYPSELHRIGPPTAEDHANGIYALHDRVLVNVQGQGWVPGEIIITKGMEYQVELAGNRTAWATPQNLRLAPAAPAAAAPKGGQPPRPGLVSCAGKFEGRYASTGFPGNITIVFRSGKAMMSDGFSSNDPELECWTGGGKIYLHKPGDSAADDFPIDINNDGTLQTPFGEVKKKGN